MKYIELTKGIKSSILGFGCAPILGSRSGNESKIALNCALNNGINHLDLARSYGYGEAEKFVGRQIRNQRHQLVLASKFGIQANWKATALNVFKPVYRILKNRNKGSKNKITESLSSKQSVSDLFHDSIQINPKNMISSLELSLKALKTDYLDYFFIHEPPSKVLLIEEVLRLSENLKKEGKIRAFGIAFYNSQVAMHADYISEFDICQFNLSPGVENYEEIRMEKALKNNILFSPMSSRATKLTSTQKLNKLHEDFPNSVILCSMFNPKHIAENCNMFKPNLNS